MEQTFLINLTKGEIEATAELLNVAVKAGGLQTAAAALHIVQKLKGALEPQPVEPQPIEQASEPVPKAPVLVKKGVK